MKRIEEGWAIRIYRDGAIGIKLITGYTTRGEALMAIESGFVIIPDGCTWAIGLNTFVIDTEPIKRSVVAWAEVVDACEDSHVVANMLGIPSMSAVRTPRCSTKVRVTVEELEHAKLAT